jgi:hypothetical protein
MNYKIIYLLTLVFLLSKSYSQTRPDSYKISGNSELLKQFAENPASNSISDIITLGDTIIWVGTSRGVSLSTDRGETWTNFSDHPAFESRGISAIRYDYNTSTFWAAKVYNTEGPGGEDVQTGGGLTFTSDNGENWSTIPHPLDALNDTLIAYGINNGVNLPLIYALDVVVPQQNVIYDMAFTPGTVWITNWAGGLRQARIDSLILNPNYRWKRVLLPSDSLSQISPEDTIRYELEPRIHNNHLGFSVETIGDSTLYVGTAGGINKSTNGGVSWRKFNHTNQENSIGGNWVIALDFDPLTQTLWAVTWRAEGQTEFYGIASTSDGGENWQTYLKDEKAYNFGFKSDDIMAPSDNGVFRTSNQGITWILPNSIVDKRTNLPFLSNKFYSAASQGNYIWLGSDDGLLRLDEDVATMWEGDWKIFLASQSLKSRNETYAFPNPFSPKLDQYIDIKYSTGGRSASVTIRIFDFDMNYISTVVQNSPRGNPTHEVDNFNIETNGVIDTWDGRDENGNIVPNGVYFYRVEVEDDEPVYGKILILQ